MMFVRKPPLPENLSYRQAKEIQLDSEVARYSYRIIRFLFSPVLHKQLLEASPHALTQ